MMAVVAGAQVVAADARAMLGHVAVPAGVLVPMKDADPAAKSQVAPHPAHSQQISHTCEKGVSQGTAIMP